MGTNSSKNQRIPSATRKRYSQDDLQSRATALTEDSSLAPTPFGAPPSSLKSRLNSRYLAETAPPPPTSSKWPAMVPAKDESLEVLDPSRQYLQDSQQWPPAMDGSTSTSKTTPPVKLPQTSNGSTLQQESDEARYLAKMYDTRTWEMYHRITEARKHTSYQSTAPSIPKSESTSEWENLQQEEEAGSSSPSGEMIFEFDFQSS